MKKRYQLWHPIRGGEDQVQIRVKLFGMMRDRFGDRSELVLELQPGATLMDARRELGIEEEGYLVTIVNGRYVPMEHELKDGDEIALFPP